MKKKPTKKIFTEKRIVIILFTAIVLSAWLWGCFIGNKDVFYLLGLGLYLGCGVFVFISGLVAFYRFK